MAALRRLRQETIERGDQALGLLLTGIELYLRLGREFDLLETMKHFADQMKDAVENTPTAEELERLYRLEHPDEDRPAS